MCSLARPDIKFKNMSGKTSILRTSLARQELETNQSVCEIKVLFYNEYHYLRMTIIDI